MSEREKAKMKLICAFFAALTALLGSHDGFAQSAYPDKAIRILVGFPPGGPPDIAARLLADKFAEAWGRPVLVENATGAGGNVAVDRAAKATPDGHTLVMASSAITINPSLYEKLPYDPVKDLAPISLVVFTPSVLVVITTCRLRTCTNLSHWHARNRASSPMGMPASARRRTFPPSCSSRLPV
jgi:tripartite-type tricarboxylate transporter receptor subunit TctC